MRERIDPGALDRRYLGCCLPEEEFVERIGRLREEQKKTQRRIEGIRHDVRAFDSEKAYNDDVDDTCCACKCCLVDEDRHCWSREEIGFRSHDRYDQEGYRQEEPFYREKNWYDEERTEFRRREKTTVPTRLKKETRSLKKEQKLWRPKNTVPMPFHMTMRDEVDQLEHRRRIEELRAKKEREEILESVYRKHLKFKARPVPQSTYYPMSSFPIKKSRLSYSSNRLNEDYISRFPLRKTRSEGFSLWDQEPTPAQPFKARDVPLSTYARPIDDEVRSQKRAAEKSERAIRMLKSSRPPSGIMDHAVRSNLIHRIRHEAKCVEKTSKRSRSVSIPDFAAIHEKWDRRMQSAKAHKLPTVTKPFNFVEQGYHEPHCENDAPEKFVRIPIRSSISLGTLAEKVPIRTNTAQLLRNEAIRRKMESFSQSQNASKEFWKERKLESHAMQRKLGKLTRSKGSTSKEIEKTTEEKRHAVAERSEDYRREIEAMKERVARRPLVLERQLILMQKQQVDRVLKSALSEAESSSKAGIPPLPISRRASSGSSKSSSVGTQGTRVISKSKSSPPKDTNGFVDDFESESTTNYENSSSTRGEDHSSSNKETSEAESSEETSDTGSGSSADLSRITEHTEHSD